MPRDDEQFVVDDEPETPDSPDTHESPDSPEGGGAKKPKEDPEVRAMRKRMADLEKENATLSERYFELARGRGKPEPEPDEDEDEPLPDLNADDEDLKPEVEDNDPGKLTDELTEKGLSALYKRGIPSKKDVAAMIQKYGAKMARQVAQDIVAREKAKMQVGAELAKYPELNDEKSELFIRTRQIVQEQIKQDPVLAKSGRALVLAVQMAKRDMELEALKKGRGRREDDYEPPTRRQRIDAQYGERSRRGGEYDEDDSTIPPEVMKLASSIGLTEAEVKKWGYDGEAPRRRAR